MAPHSGHTLLRCTNRFRKLACTFVLSLFGLGTIHADEKVAVTNYRETIQPILEQHCFDCHGYGSDEGGVAFDAFESDERILEKKKLWLAVLDNVRAGLMPPPNEVDKEDRPTPNEIAKLERWIKFDAFDIDPNNLDPGRILPRRLNRVEYQNTIRDLMGYEFRADREFPPDDSGGGFDNNSDVLTISTLLIEKYLAAAESIVEKAVPQSTPLLESNEHHPTEDSDGKEKNRKKHKRNEKENKSVRLRYVRFFPDGPAPEAAAERDEYANKILRRFASRAFRRPVEDEKVTQLVGLARSIYTKPNSTFEQGISRAMMAVLASPRFLFRTATPIADELGIQMLDEHTIASRLSYFLWSSMPDEELSALANAGNLRKEIENQVLRMLEDPKLQQGLVENFSGQWLRTRDIDSIEINGKAVLGKGKVNGNRRTKYDFDGKIRRAMREETERYFAYVLSENRSVLEFIDSDYAFLNNRLAEQYNIDNVEGNEFRLVKLPNDSYRGGVLTQGSVLAITSNPTRTSPVKRGVFILENILGTPPPPPPPNIADLENSIDEVSGEQATLSDALALHREQDVCSSCHDRMDPIGLAFENFIPMGNWRNEEAGKPIVASGKLITGEGFADVRELKRVLANERRVDFYRCLSKKMLSYAIGRGIDHRDTHTIDTMVDRLTKDQGRVLSLVMSTINSSPFQKTNRSE